MFSKLNIILLLAVTLSALYVADLRMGIKRQTNLYGKSQEEEIRLNQDRAELLYEHSRYSDAKLVSEAAAKMNMHEPPAKDIVEVR
ncbi:cell division protein FtsL [Neisseriaceae bacterium B1]